MTPSLRKLLFETLYKNRYLYRFASTVPFAGQWRTWQQLVLARLQGKDILELGCGLGDLLADMLAAGYTCRAIEQSPQMVAAARTTLGKRKLGDVSTVLQGSSQGLPFADNSFDCIVSTFPTEYIFDPDTMAEVTRVLRPDGRVIIVLAANLLPHGYLQSFLLLFHTLVYGRAARVRATMQSMTGTQTQNRNDYTQREVLWAEEVSEAGPGRHIPLEAFQLTRRSEIVHNKRWEVAITIGEKTQGQESS